MPARVLLIGPERRPNYKQKYHHSARSNDGCTIQQRLAPGVTNAVARGVRGVEDDIKIGRL